jgi:hypothetical protein
MTVAPAEEPTEGGDDVDERGGGEQERTDDFLKGFTS